MPRDMREVAKSYQIIIFDGKFNPPSSIIRQCECNMNTHSLPRASYSDNAIYFTNLTIQANNTKVYFVYSMITPINLREIYKA